ncbi:rRNA biogenesis protein RRP36 [Zea mays]|uniref:rRNA biogenesis protein RRP36 n=1 Tax=Zea mays TaxID=4577 RepID=A0A804MX74_MAIZE|nr:rRNA biogenesis protein RRP36 [Zea mays]|eukprot:XP_008673459.1 rRNA biogenesis protein RRP36 [Zea mays]
MDKNSKNKDKQLKSHPPKNAESEILREHIKKEREAAKAGKRPYYLKKSGDQRDRLVSRYLAAGHEATRSVPHWRQGWCYL